MSGKFKIAVLTAFLLLMGGPIQALAQGGHEESAGNNLAFPVIWSDGVMLTLRGTFGVTSFGGLYVDDEFGVRWYLQQDENNEWQAESADWSGAPVDVHWVDWGDNLEAVNWYETSIVRVETVLYQDVNMTGYQMQYLYGEGPSEMWGTNGLTFESTQATVYSGCARLTIQKLTKLREDPTLSLAWNPATGSWIGDVNAPLFNKGVWEAVEGPASPSSYSSEVNVPGKVIYGYNWKVRLDGDGPGDYRITFSLDGLNCTETLNTFFTTTQVVPFAEEEEEEPAGVAPAEEPIGEGGIAGISHADNLTYIDVRILEGRGGGGGGMGGGGKSPHGSADVDGNGAIDALTDGLLIVRYLFGFRGEDLINGVIGEGATRTTALDIEAFLRELML